MSSKYSISGPVKEPLGSYPKLWRLLDHHFLKEDIPDRKAVTALDKIVDINRQVLLNPKSANAKVVRSNDRGVRDLVEIGATDILTEIGWTFKARNMEECWILPYEADLETLQAQQNKLLETQQKLKARFEKSQNSAKLAATKEKADKIAIIKQIDADRAEREYKKALKTGMLPPTKAPSQSFVEIRQQAIRERLERERLKKAAAETVAQEQYHASLPGTYPAESRRVSGNQYDSLELDELSDRSQNDYDTDESMSSSIHRRATGHKRPTALSRPLKKTARVTPIPVKSTVVKERYVASTQNLGDSTGGDQFMQGGDDSPLEMDGDDMLPSSESENEGDE